VDTELIRLNNG